MKTLCSFCLVAVLTFGAFHTASAQMDMGTMLQTGLLRLTHMNSVVLPELPMNRDGSGTSWMPDQSPMHAMMWGNMNWAFMAHGNALLRYTSQDVAEAGHRGDDKVDGANWFMISANHPIALHKQITFRGMFSLDPATEGKSGYPLLFQTGESVGGAPLVDRQHPHDLYSELAFIYGSTLDRDFGYFVYAAYPGEPALGPPAFMHRPSASLLPDAPLGHHWQDATHISFGVGTLGFRYKRIKVDGSIFTGREPNELRWDFDKPRFDSYSARISVNPTERWAWQISGGYLKSPEKLEPDLNLYRATASAMYSVTFREENNLAVSAVWGVNKVANSKDAPAGEFTAAQNSYLLESNLRLAPYDLIGRVESVEKTARELVLVNFADQKFNIGALSLGVARDLYHWHQVNLSAGAQGSLFSVPNAIRPVYGQAPYSLEAFLRLSPNLMLM